MMSGKRFFTKVNKNGRNVIIDKECHIELIDLTLACEVLNRLDLKLKTYNEQLGEQQAIISKLEEEKGYWKSKAITLLSQVCRLTPKMSAKEVIEFGKELEDE